MEQRHLLLVDEQSQKDRLERIKESLKNDGIELIYQEIDPTQFTERQENGDSIFNKDRLKRELKSVPLLSHLDVFATDYNLIEEDLKGIDVIEILYDIMPHYRNHVVIYSAQIDDVINNIMLKRATDFDQQVSKLKLLAQNEISYLKSEGEFENKFKNLIKNDPEKSIDDHLSESLRSLTLENFRCSIPGYTKLNINEIGELLLHKGPESAKLKQRITDHIVAYITDIKNYE